jgi:omega-6 fatty acid desaturase (delta-12 desaturase)
MLGFGPIFTFMLLSRLPSPGVGRKERLGVLLTDVLIGGMVAAVALLAGWRIILLIQLPVLWLAGAAGIALFYVQHQFEGIYWARKAEWDPLHAAMEGCSFLELPWVLRWFSGSIGYHHVHHLGARIPNYRLKKCHDAVRELQNRTPLPLSRVPSCFRLKLWDESRHRLIPFS